MSVVRTTIIALALPGVFLALPVSVLGQESCGSIIEPSNWFDPHSSLVTHVVDDCTDPFHETKSIASPYTFLIDSTEVISGAAIETGEGGTREYRIEGDALLSGYHAYFFLHDGADYRYVNTAPSVPSEADYRMFAAEFFPPDTDVEPYIATILSGEYYLEDPVMQETLYAFIEYVDRHYVPISPLLRAGTYTLVIREYELVIGQGEKNLLERLRSFVIPEAYAESYREYTFPITFTLTEADEVSGISNILFLPGMKGSRLYMKDEEGNEEQLWEPFGSDDYDHLQMTDAGESIHDVYTRDVVDEVYGGLGGSIYGSFVEFLDALDGENGPRVQIFPYDWRYSVSDILENGTQYDTGLYKKLVETVEYLATLSKTHKVTIIAHSNGGLLAKALMVKLESLGKADLVDKIIFIATPHTGTPKAIAALLHGYDEEWKLNIPADAEDIRKVIKNMPGPHALLPSARYAGAFTEPFISFDASSSTSRYRSRYGTTIDSMSEYKDFLSGAEGRATTPDTISLPSVVNTAHFNTALTYHEDVLDAWEPPVGVEVFNVIGTGLKTPRAIEYREFVQDYCGSPTCRIMKVEPVVEFTRKGDKTVVVRSAQVPGWGSTLYFDIGDYITTSLIDDFNHANITEAEPVQLVVDKILHGSSTEDEQYISKTEPPVNSEPIRVIRIHSPAALYIEDKQGRRTGREFTSSDWKSEIPGTDYYEIGGVKYVLVPDSIDHTVVIQGEGSGVVTHATDLLQSETQHELNSFRVSVSSSTRVTYAYERGTTSAVAVDQNGDGVTDYKLTVGGEVIDERATYTDLKNAIRNLKLPRLKEAILMGIADQAEQFYKKRTDPKLGRTYERLEEGALYLLDQTLIQLQKAHVITLSSYRTIKSVIDKLIRQ